MQTAGGTGTIVTGTTFANLSDGVFLSAAAFGGTSGEWWRRRTCCGRCGQSQGGSAGNRYVAGEVPQIALTSIAAGGGGSGGGGGAASGGTNTITVVAGKPTGAASLTTDASAAGGSESLADGGSAVGGNDLITQTGGATVQFTAAYYLA